MVQESSEGFKYIKGLFITLEGGEGAGKTSIAGKVQQKLLGYINNYRSYQQDVILTSEPGGTQFGLEIRHMILSGKYEICDLTELLLFLAQRVEHSRNVILPALKRKNIILCDRYNDSSIVYQLMSGASEFIDYKEYIMKRIESCIALPDITFVIDIDPATAMERLKNKQPDRFERLGEDFFKEVNSHFLELAEKRNKEVITEYYVLDGRKPIEVNTRIILDIIIPRLYA